MQTLIELTTFRSFPSFDTLLCTTSTGLVAKLLYLPAQLSKPCDPRQSLPLFRDGLIT